MDRMKSLLIVVSGLAVAALVLWLGSSDATISMPPAALQLKIPATPATSKDVATVAPSNEEAALPRAKDTAKALSDKSPKRVNRRDQPAAASVGRLANAVPPSAPDINAPAPVMTYEQRVTAAITVAGVDSERALLELQHLAAGEPGRPEAYEAMAGISLRRREYGQARELIGSALGRGGKATFTLIHDHSRGNFDSDPKATCVGELTILAAEVKFAASGDGDRFSANWADVRETGSNRFFGSGIGAFHVTLTAGGKYKNFNLAPESKDKAEGKLILDLLTTYTRGGDRTK